MAYGCTFDAVVFNVSGTAWRAGNPGSSAGMSVACPSGADIIAFSYKQEGLGGYGYGGSFSGLHSIGPFLCADGSCVPGYSANTGGLCGGFSETGGYQLPSPPC